MKRKLKIMSHQIDQLKEEIASKVAKISGCLLSGQGWREGGRKGGREVGREGGWKEWSPWDS